MGSFVPHPPRIGEGTGTAPPDRRGFKVAILAGNVKDLRLFGNDVSRSWKQRLHSRVEKEQA